MEEFNWGFVTYLNKERGWCCVLGLFRLFSKLILRDVLGYFFLEEALGSTKTNGLMTLTETSQT